MTPTPSARSPPSSASQSPPSPRSSTGTRTSARDHTPARARPNRRARLPPQRRGAEPHPEAHPHPRRHRPRPDALVLRRDRRCGSRGSSVRAAMDCSSAPGARTPRTSGRSSRCCSSGRWTASCSPLPPSNTDQPSVADDGKGLVLVDRDDHIGVTCHRVITDDEEVGRLATGHLIALGHRAIAHLSAPGARPRAAARARLQRYDARARPRDARRAGSCPAASWSEGYEAMQQRSLRSRASTPCSP